MTHLSEKLHHTCFGNQLLKLGRYLLVLQVAGNIHVSEKIMIV